MNFRLPCLTAFTLLLAAWTPLTAAVPHPPSKSVEQAKSAPETRKGDSILQPEDQLRIFVFKEDDITKQGEVSISQEHTITLPLIGTISLRGLTARQAEEKIRALYDKDYLVNPQVTVTVHKYAERSVNVFGSVKKQGRVLFPPEGGMTLLDALSGADGHDRLASLKAVKLTRKNANGEPISITVDVDAILKGGGKDDIPLQPGDQIYVPERII